MGISEKLMNIQADLKAPKNQFNSFGKYNYRSCEDIMEGVKPLLKQYKATLTVSDEVVLIGDRYYIKATAKIRDIETTESIEVTALAREEETKKGMDSSQVTGSTSSYARKYALNGLFSIDDTKDSDSTNTHGKDKPKENKQQEQPQQNKSNGVLNEAQIKRLYAIANSVGHNQESVKKTIFAKYKISSTSDLTKQQYDELCAGYESLKKKVQ